MSVRDDIPITKRLVELGLDQFVHPPINASNSAKATEISQVVAMLATRAIPVTTTIAGFDGYKDANGADRVLLAFPFGPRAREMFEACCAASECSQMEA